MAPPSSHMRRQHGEPAIEPAGPSSFADHRVQPSSSVLLPLPAMVALLLLLLLLTAPLRVASAASGGAASRSPGAVAVPPPAALFWCVADVRPGETLLCALGQRLPIGTGNLTLRIAPSGNATTALEAAATLSPSGDAVSAVVPAVAPVGAYSVQLLGDGGSELSETFLVNAPELWWAQGDRGAAASPGGWIRLFGRGLTLPRDERERQRCVPCELDGVVHALVQVREQEDVDWQLVASLAAQAERLATTQRLLQQQAETGGGGSGATTLNITTDAPGSHSIVLQASARRLSTFSAEFVVPVATPPGNYSVSLSNGQAATGLSWFLSPQQPARHVIEIRAARQQSARTFRVADYGCAGGINRTNPKDLTSAEPVDCTAAINRALVAAAQHSPAPSTVLFGPGRWYLQPPLLLPDGVTIAGDSMSTTALYFAQVSVNTSFANPPAGMPALIGPTESPAAAAAAAAAAVRDGTSTTSFGIQDMCIYALSYYSTVINISASTSGVAVRRVRIRANAFNGRNGDTRRVPWQDTIGANGPPVILLQGTSSEIVDCDIYATWLAIASHGHYGPSSPAHSSRFTLIRNNTIWNGGACFWADQAKEVIFEGNTCSGISPMSGGNGIMTYGGG